MPDSDNAKISVYYSTVGGVEANKNPLKAYHKIIVFEYTDNKGNAVRKSMEAFPVIKNHDLEALYTDFKVNSPVKKGFFPLTFQFLCVCSSSYS